MTNKQKEKKELETPKFELNLFVDDIKTSDPSNTGGNTGEWEGDENVPGGGSEGWV